MSSSLALAIKILITVFGKDSLEGTPGNKEGRQGRVQEDPLVQCLAEHESEEVQQRWAGRDVLRGRLRERQPRLGRAREQAVVRIEACLHYLHIAPFFSWDTDGDIISTFQNTKWDLNRRQLLRPITTCSRA